MASSKIISTTSPANPELPFQPSMCSSPSTLLLSDLHNGQHHPPGSMNMDDLFKSIYSSPPVSGDAHAQVPCGPLTSTDGRFSVTKADEAWKEIEAGSDRVRGGAWEEASSRRMTLEDFLTKAGTVGEGGGGGVQVGTGAGIYGVDAGIGVGVLIGSDDAVAVDEQRPVVRRGKRRAVVERPMDKATQQKQRRMIKNRESAARSRERKQAYTVELESLVTQLEEENSRLLRDEAEQNRQRLKQIKERLVPVEEQRKPPRELRRIRSLQW